MKPIYAMVTTPEWYERFRVHHAETIAKNWWNFEVISQANFEDAGHLLETSNDGYTSGISDLAPDICDADTTVWAFAEAAWDWLPALADGGCRVAHTVRVAKGKKQFKLVYAAPILDLLDHDRCDFSWNRGTISWVRDIHLYRWNGEPPPMFKVLLHNREIYRGVRVAPYQGTTFVSQAFKNELERRRLSGVEFIEMPRTTRPPECPEPDKVIVYRP